VGEILDSGGILVTESADDPSCAIQLETLRISLDEFIENSSRSGFGELPILSR
jgi:hypothetical protein